MKVVIEHRLKNELTREELKRLNQLHLRYGLMWGYFQTHDDCDIVLATHKNKIIGWALIFFNEDKLNNEFHVYVSKYSRRLGIGTKLFEYASELYPDGLWVSKWSEEASAFYNNFEVIEEDYDDEE